MLQRVVLSACLLVLPATAGATAAWASSGSVPLPVRKPASSAPAARTCHIGSFSGVLMPGTNVCVKAGGFVRSETRMGGDSR
jgi:hypothetical protein